MNLIRIGQRVINLDNVTEVGPIAGSPGALRVFFIGDECRDLGGDEARALKEFLDRLVRADGAIVVPTAAEEESNYDYLRNGLITHLIRAGIIDGSESYGAWPDGLLNAVYALREQRDALLVAGAQYYHSLRGQSPTCDETMEKALKAVSSGA